MLRVVSLTNTWPSMASLKATLHKGLHFEIVIHWINQQGQFNLEQGGLQSRNSWHSGWICSYRLKTNNSLVNDLFNLLTALSILTTSFSFFDHNIFTLQAYTFTWLARQWSHGTPTSLMMSPRVRVYCTTGDSRAWNVPKGRSIGLTTLWTL